LEKEVWNTKAQDIELFKKSDGTYKTQFSLENLHDEPGTSGAIRLTLNQSSLQDVYPKLYTLALSRSDKEKTIPNEPYIPFAEDIELNYSATESAYSYLRKDSEGEASKMKNTAVS
jgi:hypothetical protein